MKSRLAGLHAAVESLVQQQGALEPLELLIQQSRLAYDAYEAWRRGEIDCLEAALSGNPQRVRQMLTDAADWARRLGLKPQRNSYSRWGGGPELRFSADREPAAEALYATCYRPDTEVSQLDLFLDAGPTLALNDLAEALATRQAGLARERLTALLRLAPEHDLRAAAELLCDALDNLEAGQQPPPEVALPAIRQQLEPAARSLLGSAARDLLAPFWRRLAADLAGRPLDPRQPELHASWAYAQCLDWPAVLESLATETGQPGLTLARRAEALARSGDRAGALAQWCRLCWLDPGCAQQVLSDVALPDSGVRRAWLSFQELEESELSEIAWFPAWLLLADRGLARQLDDSAAEACDGDAARAFTVLRTLLVGGLGNTSKEQMQRRKALNDLNPDLFLLVLHGH